MTENDNIQELEEMRLQLGELKSMLKEQTIVNERMMRKAMKGKYNKVRNEIKFSIVFAFLAMPFMAIEEPVYPEALVSDDAERHAREVARHEILRHVMAQ